jgi:hypothetical protein
MARIAPRWSRRSIRPHGPFLRYDDTVGYHLPFSTFEMNPSRLLEKAVPNSGNSYRL